MAKTDKKLKIKKFSDIDNWSAKEDKNAHIPKVNVSDLDLDTTVGKKFSDIFRKYGLGIQTVGIGSWIHNHKILLPGEKGKVEYRVSLGKYLTMEDLVDNFGTDDPAKFLEENDGKKDKNYKEFMTMYDNIQKGTIEDVSRNHSNLEFSVFLDKRVNGIDSEIGHIAVWQAAALYLGIIKASSMNNIIAGRMEYYEALTGDVDSFKKFLKLHECKVSLENLEDVTTWAYRVYKDSKFFAQLRDEWPQSRRLIEELLNAVVPSINASAPFKN